jgi:hypothetical protein
MNSPSEGTENPPLSLSSTCAGQQYGQLAIHSVKEEEDIKKGGFTVLKEDPYHHTCFFQ